MRDKNRWWFMSGQQVDDGNALEIIDLTETTSLTNNDKRWESMFALLIQYKEREGNCNVPARHKEDEINLGIWLMNQKRYKKTGVLKSIRRNKLENLGVIWERRKELTEMFDKEWDSMFNLLLQYQKEEGDCNVPHYYIKEKKLGIWLLTQKTKHRLGEINPLRQQRLEQAGVVFSKPRRRWDDNYDLLVEFKQRNGHCNVPVRYTENGIKLGAWLNNQKTEKGTGLTSERWQRLEDIGVIWDRFEKRWEDTFALLVQYKEREGHCNVPRKHKENGIVLGTWLYKRKRERLKGDLNFVRQRKLEEIGVVWRSDDNRMKKWDDMFDLLVEYKEREGNCNVPFKHEEKGKNLGTWLYTQRGRERSGKLNSTRRQRLEDVGVVWREK